MDVEKQVLIIWAATSGHLDDVPVDQARRFEADFLRFVEASHPATLAAIREKKALTDEIKADLGQVVADFKSAWQERQLNPQPEPPGITATATGGTESGAAAGA
jgi:F-type H+-transporting ATPase subunit alpha